MSISVAKVVGEISAGFITIALNPDMTGTDAVNNTASELIASIPVDIFPEELKEPDTDIWFASVQPADGAKSHIRKIFPLTSDEIPEEYYAWLEENGINTKR